ncbi:hypothetical protein HOD30_05080 [Candidatus Peregrinibacteria bacterium]|jgi:hypothetical protein|nr:hypothetical protein [Candidatus Peregrinibacteria bacterium]MBT4631397.1 hypothetical protein [Candidatus Peregrinibacteria bacterium]MBT5824017.1 hypothetical protein [Candidatus Peregrinibacteria bacterium]
MAKGKSVAYVWVCSKTKRENGSGRARREKIKEMTKLRYCPALRVRTKHKAKAVKKGGTKALANAK